LQILHLLLLFLRVLFFKIWCQFLNDKAHIIGTGLENNEFKNSLKDTKKSLNKLILALSLNVLWLWGQGYFEGDP